MGRAAFDLVLASFLGTEACMARAHLTGAGHALACTLFACLRPGDDLVIATGPPTATARATTTAGPGALAEWGVQSHIVALRAESGTVDTDALVALAAQLRPAAVLLQRCPGAVALEATPRRAYMRIRECRAVIDAVRLASPGTAVVVDNAGAELVEEEEVGATGADAATGSLAGALGGGVVMSGGYVAGRQALVARACAHMSAPGLSLDAGSVDGDTLRLMFQGLFLAPGMVGEVWKGALYLHSALANAGLLKGGGGTQPVYPATELLLPTTALCHTLATAVQRNVPLSTASSSMKVTLADGRAALRIAGGLVPGGGLDAQAVISVDKPHEAVLFGGTHWSHWMNVVDALRDGMLAV